MREDPYAILQVDRSARPEVIEAAFRVLRELLLSEDPPDAPQRLAALNRAHRTLTETGRRRAHGAGG